jgi:hypothetical protein
MTSFRSKPRLARVMFAAMIGAAVLAGGSSQTVWAADDDDETLADTKVLRYILKGLGLRRGDDEAGIEYRERSPLVLPANKQLPTPETVKPASKTAGWPDDPDLKRVKQKKDAEKNRKAYIEGVDDRPLLPSQYGQTSAAGRGEKPTILDSKTDEDALRPSTVKELGAKNIFSKVWGNNNTDDSVTFTGEPPRANLIEPPRGYRTPSPNQPFGVGKERWTAPKVDRQEIAK